jgi:2,5-diketo-D-gluconate reductase A
VQDAVEQWLRLGGRHIDTADDYGTQPDVGRALKASGVPRKDVFITTKIPGPIGAKEATDKILNTALKQLQVDYIDLVLIHFPCKVPAMIGCGDEQKAERLDTFKGLLQLRKDGKIRAVGVSNWDGTQVDDIQAEFGEPPATNQVQYHLASHDDKLLKHMKDVGTVLEAWASLGGPTVHGKQPTISLGDARLKRIADFYNASTAQVVLRWETQKGVVPVTATCNKDHALGDLSSFSLTLSDADMLFLDALMPSNRIVV